MATVSNIIIGQYVPGDSAVHQLDPRTKILVSLMLITALFLMTSFVGYGLVALYVLTALMVSRIPPRFVLRGLRPLLFIIVITFLMHLFLTPGEQLAQIWFFRPTREGLVRGAFMTSRLVLLVVGTSLLTLTTSPIALTDAIEHLLGPGRRIGIPAHELAMMMTIALRFIPTLLEETDKIMKAQMARGADFESGNLVQRAKNLVPLLVPLFVSAFRRADELANAMEARCYRGGKGRSKLKQLRFRAMDFVVLGSTTAFVVVGSIYL